jgi:hypothetical protein
LDYFTTVTPLFQAMAQTDFKEIPVAPCCCVGADIETSRQTSKGIGG